MGNNQAALHKRERTSDGTQRARRLSGSMNSPLPPSVSTDDGCPVQMRIAKDDFDPSADLLESNEYPVVFKWSTQNHPARVVYLAGSWDQWKSKIPLVKSTNDFSTIINLNPGECVGDLISFVLRELRVQVLGGREVDDRRPGEQDGEVGRRLQHHEH